MSSWNKSFAGFGALCAFILLFQLIPKQTIVVGPKRSISVVPTADKPAAGQKPKLGITPKSRTADGASAEPPQDQDAPAGKPSPSEAPAASAKDVTAAPAAKSADLAETPVEGPVVESINFGARGLAASASSEYAAAEPARADPWEPVVTRSDVPAKAAGPVAAKTEGKPDAKPADSVLTRSSAKPESNWKEDGIGDTHPSVAPVLAAHPDRDLILCIAGCGNGTKIVKISKRTQVLASAGELIPSAAGPAKATSGDIICIAGCVGAPGKVVYRNVRLSWISDEGNNAVKAALRAIADRIIAAEGLSIDDFERTWMSNSARDHLLPDAPDPGKLAFAGPKVAAWMRRLPGIATAD